MQQGGINDEENGMEGINIQDKQSFKANGKGNLNGFLNFFNNMIFIPFPTCF
jgi:hypothetical protein